MSFAPELFQPNKAVGGNGGGDFQLLAKNGAFVKRIRVYHGTSKWGSNGSKGLLSGIEVDFTDGKTATCGVPDNSGKFVECQLEVGKDEKIKSMSLYGMGDGQWDRTSELTFTTNKDQSLTAGSKEMKENEYKMDVGSGLLIGFQGRAGGIIDSLQPIFLKRVAKQYINNVEYPDLLKQDLDFLQPQYVDRQKARWDGMSSKVKLSGEIKEKEDHTKTNKISILASVTLEFMAGVPFVTEGGIKTTLSVGYEHTWASSEGKEKLLRYDVEKEMNGPDDQFELLAMYRKGETTLDYTGTFNVVTEDGAKFSFPTSGTVKSVLFTQMEIIVRRYDDEGKPDDQVLVGGETRSLEVDGEEEYEERGVEDVPNDIENKDYAQEEEQVEEEVEEAEVEEDQEQVDEKEEEVEEQEEVAEVGEEQEQEQEAEQEQEQEAEVEEEQEQVEEEVEEAAVEEAEVEEDQEQVEEEVGEAEVEEAEVEEDQEQVDEEEEEVQEQEQEAEVEEEQEQEEEEQEQVEEEVEEAEVEETEVEKDQEQVDEEEEEVEEQEQEAEEEQEQEQEERQKWR
ncbi:hypothetical protein EsH8_XII_000001 [Colletotrichum jinshuiense]